MASDDKWAQEFLDGLAELEPQLLTLGFIKSNIRNSGYAWFVSFDGEGGVLEFLFGPSDWDVEMIIYVNDKKFALRELMQNLTIRNWILDNRYVRPSKMKDIKGEINWLYKLLVFALPIIENVYGEYC